MSEKVRRVVHIGGREIALITADSPEYLRRLEDFTNRKLSETSIAARIPASAAAPLCCLDLADELLKAKDENQRLRREMEQLRK